MAQSDDLATLTALVSREFVLSGRARHLRLTTQLPLSELAKAAGCTPEQVGLWEAGRATPTTRQSLAWLGHLLERASWRATVGDGPGE
jgi:transcriptional regulator with XRE-family HTH domain